MKEKIPQVTIYAKSAGVEIGPYEKRSEGRPPVGRIALRFFRMESGSAAIRFVAEPAEGYELFRKISQVFRDGGKATLNHRFDGSEGEVVTRLTVERFERGGKPGYAFAVQRGDDEINVPVAADRFLHAAEFLRHLSLTQAWVDESERPPREGAAGKE